jgi:hypothetical protein
MFSMHTATVGLIEALLVGIAAERRSAVVAELSSLNRLRERAAGSRMDLQVSVADTHEGSKRTRPARTRSQRSSD